MLQIFNCPHCQGVFKAECDTANSHVECPHCLNGVEVGALPTSDHGNDNQAQEAAEVNEQAQAWGATQTVDSAAPDETVANTGDRQSEKPKMTVTEAEVTRSILPPGFNKTRKPENVEPAMVPEESANSTVDDHEENSKSLLTVPIPVGFEVNENSGEEDVEDSEPTTESADTDNTSNESESEDDDLVLPSLLENATTLPSAGQVLGSLAESDSSQAMSAGIHVIETNEEEAALIESVIEDRRQFKRKKNVLMWFFGFVIIALTLLLLIK